MGSVRVFGLTNSQRFVSRASFSTQESPKALSTDEKKYGVFGYIVEKNIRSQESGFSGVRKILRGNLFGVHECSMEHAQ